jgi:hypothetical protein
VGSSETDDERTYAIIICLQPRSNHRLVPRQTLLHIRQLYFPYILYADKAACSAACCTPPTAAGYGIYLLTASREPENLLDEASGGLTFIAANASHEVPNGVPSMYVGKVKNLHDQYSDVAERAWSTKWRLRRDHGCLIRDAHGLIQCSSCDIVAADHLKIYAW